MKRPEAMGSTFATPKSRPRGTPELVAVQSPIVRPLNGARVSAELQEWEADVISGLPSSASLVPHAAQQRLSAAPPVVRDVLSEAGRPLDENTRYAMESRFGHDFSRIRVHSGGRAAESTDALHASAYGVGHHLVFGEDGYAPGTLTGDRLLAHELTHVLQSRQERETSPLIRLKPRADDGTNTYPWVGRITGAWSVALRGSPDKKPDDPHRNTRSDLPRGSEVLVIGRRGGWLHVSAQINGVQTDGYVSQEFVSYVRPSAFELPELVITVKVPSVPEALVILKRAETKKAAGGALFKPSEDEAGDIGLAISVLERSGKYVVDHSTFTVGFVETVGKKVEITSIAEFVVFVEQVERQYPAATPAEIASEIRQLWFSDVNWELLVSSKGVSEGDKEVDIETRPNPIANRFEIEKLAPKEGGKQFSTPHGTVDIGHVLAGIDASLSPFPAEYPEKYLEARGHESSDTRLKYETLKKASGGRSRDFTTWAGDFGQAYAEYLVAKYVKKDSTATLAKFMADKATKPEVLGDIHGYTALEAWQNMPEESKAGGNTLKISNLLRDFYLSGDTTSTRYGKHVQSVSGVSDLMPFIIERSKAFARPWFAKKAYEAKGWWSSEGWGAKGVLENWLEEFDRVDADNDQNAAPEDQLGTFLDKTKTKTKTKSVEEKPRVLSPQQR
jgi:Domain of unknown function (DUF4157)